jgi:hypothetical protein
MILGRVIEQIRCWPRSGGFALPLEARLEKAAHPLLRRRNRLQGSIDGLRLELGVGSVAEDGVGGVLASAEIGGPGLCCFKFDRCAVGGLVAAVAKGLVGAEAAGTPEVAFSCFQLDGIRASLSNFRFGHGNISSLDDREIIA